VVRGLGGASAIARSVSDAREVSERRRQFAVGVVAIVQCQGHLLQVVRRLDACSGLAHLLDSGDEQANQDRDDGDHHQQLDQCEAA
jgi:hypothetical protein